MAFETKHILSFLLRMSSDSFKYHYLFYCDRKPLSRYQIQQSLKSSCNNSEQAERLAAARLII
jgi:hypothetical protein